MEFHHLVQEVKLFAAFSCTFYFTVWSIKKAIKTSHELQSSNRSTQPDVEEEEISSMKAIKIAEQGDAAMEAKKWDDAIAFYTAAIRLNKDDSNTATYFTKRAEAYLGMGCVNLAKDDCNSAIVLEDKNSKAYLIRGKVLERLGYDMEAQQDFRRAHHLDVGGQ